MLVGYDAPVGWPAAITAACNAFEATFALQDSAKGQSVAKNAELYAIIEEMNAFKGALRHHVKNNAAGKRPSRLGHRRPRRETMKKNANNPGKLAAWLSASHVER